MVHSTTWLTAIETTRQLHRMPDVEIKHVMTVLWSLKLSDRTRDIQHIEVARGARAYRHQRGGLAHM